MSQQTKQNDISGRLQDQVKQAIETGSALVIKAGGSKSFYGHTITGNELRSEDLIISESLAQDFCSSSRRRNGRIASYATVSTTQKTGKKTSQDSDIIKSSLLSVAGHQGIINYEPTELVMTARAGTPLKIIEQTLSENNQILAFEPPAFGDNATLGGTIACNFSGPRRAYSGAARDYVLGAKIINGKAEILSFGGEVMKNVAGYDVSRLMTGAMGTLGVLLEISLKVVPKPEAEITMMQKSRIDEALTKLHQWSAHPLPISASCFYQDNLYIRLSGAEKAIRAAQKTIGGEVLNEADEFWSSVKEQKHDFFKNDQPLWRMSLASNSPILSLEGDMLYEWGGALRWLKTDTPQDQMWAFSDSLNGHISLFRALDKGDQVFQALPKHLLRLHQNLKQAFDPHGIFNIGRMYQAF